tara:strand:+ start:542 stop:727 length:186 start_codon:yes stop_codon:yes gene_type:complete
MYKINNIDENALKTFQEDNNRDIDDVDTVNGFNGIDMPLQDLNKYEGYRNDAVQQLMKEFN